MPWRSRFHRRRTPLIGIVGARFCENGAITELMGPAPLTPLQKRIVLALSVMIALTRFFAVARAPFDWDEGLFSLAVRDYDVTQHHPHPPGYPLFIVAAKFFHLFGLSEFRSLQAVVLLGGFL